MYSIIVTIVAILVNICDAAYYLRAIVLVYGGRLVQRKYYVDETTAVYGICTSRDVDFYFTHMNNARYLRVLDSCRIHFYDRIGFYPIVAKNKAGVIMAATTVRYSRPIGIFDLYKVETKILCWDDKTIFLEQKFITLKDKSVKVVVLSRTHIVGLDLPKVMEGFPGADKLKEFPEEVNQWQASLETISGRIRKNVRNG